MAKKLTIAQWAERAGVSKASALSYQLAVKSYGRAEEKLRNRIGFSVSGQWKTLDQMGTRGIREDFLTSTTKTIRSRIKTLEQRTMQATDTFIENAASAIYNFYGETSEDVIEALNTVRSLGTSKEKLTVAQTLQDVFEERYSEEGEWDFGPDTGRLEFILRNMGLL